MFATTTYRTPIGSRTTSNPSALGRSIELRTIRGTVTTDGVVFGQSLPDYYVVRVNGVTFSKTHFAQLSATMISRRDYINPDDLVELDYSIII
jgi:hypothetical protein